MTDERVIRLALDINVLVADILSRHRGGRSTASTRIVDAVRNGVCSAGPVQLVTSLPLIENFADVLQRRLGYDAASAAERAWVLEQYALGGPMPTRPYVTVGSGYIPFETEEQLERSIETHLRPKNVEKLFNEIQDDRYILETALAGRADILVTANVDDFRKGPAVRLQRNDVVLFPVADLTLVIATPWFTAYWLGQGIVPDSQFIAEHAEDFASYVTPSG